MANINVKLTLLTSGGNAGPLYDAYYTINNVTYIIAGSNLSLPSVGSEVTITIPDNSNNVKLVNLTAGCQANYYIVPVVTTTTTTSTTSTTTTCNPTPNWVNTGFSCYSTCNKYNVQTDQNPCSPTYNTTRQGSLVEPNSTYCGGCCGQSTAATWTNEGSTYCESCVSKQLQRDTNSCSATYNQTRVINSGSACNTSANWVNSGSYNCYSTCNKYNVEVDNNPCSSTYNQTRQGSLVESNSTFCGGCCGQSTTPNWVDNGAAYCDSCVSKQPQIDNNPCSSSYNQTQVVNGGSACNTTQSWVNSGNYNCYSTCNKYNVEIQNNPCASGYNTTRQGSVAEFNSTFCGGCCGQSTAANWVNSGSYNCYGSCTKYNVEVDNNGCSPTYNQTQQGSAVEFNSAFCGGCCGASPSANWVNNGATFCSGCTLYQPQIDNNVCSATYGDTRNVDLGINSSCGSWPTSYYCVGCAYYSHEVNSCTGTIRNIILISSDSTSCGGCCGQSTSPSWTDEGSAYCDNCVSKQLQRDTNPCSSTYNQTRVINSGSACNTSATWTNEGSAYCDNCVSKQLQRDTNPCSATYNQTRVINSGTACDYTANWVNSGSYNCYSTCNKYNVEVDNNPCSSTYNDTRPGSIVEYNSTFCGGCCGQSTGPNWVDNGATFCDGCNLQQPQIDSNPCSATYGDTRNVDLGVSTACGAWVQSFYCVGYDKWSKETNSCTGNIRNEFLVEVNSAYCGYVPPPACRTYQIVGDYTDESVNGIYTNCSGGSDSFSFFGGPGTVGYICALAGSVYVTSGNGSANDVGGC